MQPSRWVMKTIQDSLSIWKDGGMYIIMGMWIRGVLDNFICNTLNCYAPTMMCKCRQCGLGRID